MSTSYWRVEELARELTEVADEVDAHTQAGHALRLPTALTQAAQRIAAASDRSRVEAALATMPVSQAVVYLTDHQEVVTATELQVRLSRIGREVPLATVTVALHRARERGQLVSRGRGRFARPGPTDTTTSTPPLRGGSPSDG
ncbi:hypothetical protein [Pseudonocardia humida]|uniref:Uncharacterized protein n=1 Tax=Pseudonocardia humida TaxID=2800819 RepID=A0ABT1A868_9PSEU|nr:hypothetical protein [Pseudonocardia humida]MCO1659198.1 hypothetical protein [Pseudonocardia humida]